MATQKDPKCKLNEWCQRAQWPKPIYQPASHAQGFSSNCAVKNDRGVIIKSVSSRHFWSRVKDAEQEAAAIMLSELCSPAASSIKHLLMKESTTQNSTEIQYAHHRVTPDIPPTDLNSKTSPTTQKSAHQESTFALAADSSKATISQSKILPSSALSLKPKKIVLVDLAHNPLYDLKVGSLFGQLPYDSLMIGFIDATHAHYENYAHWEEYKIDRPLGLGLQRVAISGTTSQSCLLQMIFMIGSMVPLLNNLLPSLEQIQIIANSEVAQAIMQGLKMSLCNNVDIVR
jgi:hypothetical protein